MISTAIPSMQQEQRRRSHYTPAPLAAHMILTVRDDLIFSLLDEYRLLRPRHLAVFLEEKFGAHVSEQGLLRRLRTLMDWQYLLRIRNDPERATVAGGSLQKIYGRPERRNLALNERRETASRVIPHTLAVADTMADVVRACCDSAGHLRYLRTHEVDMTLAPSSTGQQATPVRWKMRVCAQGHWRTVGITPDKVFGVHYLTRPPERARSFFCLEEDLNTEPIVRKNLQGTAIFRKLLTYAFTYSRQFLWEQYQIKGFRALFVTTTPQRAASMQAVYDLVNDELSAAGIKRCPANVFLFIDRPTLRAGNFFTVPWRNGHGEVVTLTPADH
jgi:hypothetical protein